MKGIPDCHSRWEEADAQVVCRQLGYTGGEPRSRSAFGDDHGYVWMDNVECNGDEMRLIDCRYRPWEENDCGPHEAAGVVCDNGKHMVTSWYGNPFCETIGHKWPVIQSFGG